MHDVRYNLVNYKAYSKEKQPILVTLSFRSESEFTQLDGTAGESRYGGNIFFSMVSGVQRSGDARGQLLDCMLPPKLSSTQECDKDRHLKYVKSSVEKKFLKNKTKLFQRVFFCFKVVIKVMIWRMERG